MKNFAVLIVFAGLMVTGCGTTWPERGANYWKDYVENNKPHSDETIYFHPEGGVDRDVYLEEDEGFELKFVETLEGEPIWIIEVNEDGEGYFVFHEKWDNDGELLERVRKLKFQLGDVEYDELRDVILASGFLSVRNEFGGDGTYYWLIGVGADGDIKNVNFRGGYPDEAQQLVYGAYEIIVVPRASKMDSAEVLKTEDLSAEDEAQPLD